jgi:hypothetical protein
MKSRDIASIIITASALAAAAAMAAQDRWSLTSPSGISFTEVKDYESWGMVGSSMPDDEGGCGTSKAPGCIKSIVANSTMIKAYNGGFPANGAPVPDGAAFAKIEWEKARDQHSPYGAFVPGRFAEVAFMIKDSTRFRKTDGWGYATFQYDEAKEMWKVKHDTPDFLYACHGCHTVVKARDFVFTNYPKR